jgi:hypothetical protein
MGIFKKSILFSTLLSFLIVCNLPALAILGNTKDQNQQLYGSPMNIPRYHHSGAKNIIIYKKDNADITVVYRNDISILENISYPVAVNLSTAIEDMKSFILPPDNQIPAFSSRMPFGEAHFEENIYKNGIKTKIIFNSTGQATEIISSMISGFEIAKDQQDD